MELGINNLENYNTLYVKLIYLLLYYFLDYLIRAL